MLSYDILERDIKVNIGLENMKMKVIAIDNDHEDLKVLSDVVRAVLPDVVPACFRFPGEALEYAEKHIPDIVFLDVEIQQMDGITLARRLKYINPVINIIFVTSCREQALEAFRLRASGYILKPVTSEAVKVEIDNLRFPVKFDTGGIYVSTFGQFDIMVYGKSIHFGRSKSKEMLAYLVDRRGAGVTRKELAAVLFEDRKYTRSTQDYLNKIVHELEASLSRAGAGDILIKQRNYYAVDTSKITCDMYEYENGNPAAVRRFNGEYMAQYSWGEEMLGQLISDGRK